MVVALVFVVLLMSGMGSGGPTVIQPGVEERSRFYESCVGHSTAAACSCILSGGGCGCLVDGFHADEEWEAFRRLRCAGKPASADRLLYSYSQGRCPFSPTQCAEPGCATGLAGVEQEIRDVLGLDPSDSSANERYCSDYFPEVVPGSKIDLAGPIPFEVARVLGVTGVALGLGLMAYRAVAPTPVVSLQKSESRA